MTCEISVWLANSRDLNSIYDREPPTCVYHVHWWHRVLISSFTMFKWKPFKRCKDVQIVLFPCVSIAYQHIWNWTSKQKIFRITSPMEFAILNVGVIAIVQQICCHDVIIDINTVRATQMIWERVLCPLRSWPLDRFTMIAYTAAQISQNCFIENRKTKRKTTK